MKQKKSTTKIIECPSAEKFLEMISPRSKYLETYEPYRVLFRGHSDERFTLVPTALRVVWPKQKGKASATNHHQVMYEADLIQSFYWLADRCGLPLPEDSQTLRNSIFSADAVSYAKDPDGNINWPPREIWSLLALAQHHGLRTRLLDWSLDAARAAYFAAVEAARWVTQPKKAPRGLKNIAVWALNRTDIKVNAVMSMLMADIGESYSSFADRISIITAPSAGNKNLHAQKGLFTLYRPLSMKPEDPIDTRPLDVIISEENISVTLLKFVLPVTQTPRLLRLLAFEGASGADLFPGYDGIVKGLREKDLWDPDE